MFNLVHPLLACATEDDGSHDPEEKLIRMSRRKEGMKMSRRKRPAISVQRSRAGDTGRRCRSVALVGTCSEEAGTGRQLYGDVRVVQ